MKSIIVSQESKYAELKKGAGKLDSLWNPYAGTFRYIKGKLIKLKNPKKPQKEIIAFIDNYDVLFCQSGKKSNFEIYFKQKQTDGNYRYRVNFHHDEIPVIDGQISALVSDGMIVEVRSNLDRLIRFTGKFVLEERDVLKALKKYLTEDPGYNDFVDEMEHEILPDHVARTHVTHEASSTRQRYPLLLLGKLRKVYKKVTDGYHPAWMGFAYLPIPNGQKSGLSRIGAAEFILDATNGELLSVESAEESVETPADLIGVPVILPSGTPDSVNMRGVEDGGNYYLKNVDNDIEILTYNGNGVSDGILLANAFNADTLDICIDGDGDFANTDDTCVQANRDSSQQPDTDAHRFAQASYVFYKSRFDWDGFDNGVDGGPVKMVVHCDLSSGSGAAFHKYEDSGTSNMYGFLKFFDGRCSGGSLEYDFFAGDQCTLAHEYQHALTYFGSRKSNGDPGYLYGLTIFGAFREGLSDSFGGMVSGTWQLRSQSPTGVAMPGVAPLRSIEFPRDPGHTAGILADHYEEIGNVADKYFKSTIFSHLAFLVAKGGIHERASRGAQYIPCRPIGTDDAAAIWFNSLTDRFDSLDSIENDERMIDASNILLETAEDLFGNTSKEYVLLRRAMYAVGTYPWMTSVSPYTKQSYGGEACMIPWGHDWECSRNYLPLDYQRWKSIDLFIDNGDGVTYNANIDSENKVYARVRNIGDEALNNIRVEFFYRKYGSALPASETDWRRCQDSSGTDCTLNITSLAAEITLFGDTDYTDAHAVNWYLDPDEVSDDVNHFCLRAVIHVDDPAVVNHQNDYSDSVQSNVKQVVVETDDDADTSISFMANNPSKKTQKLDLEIAHTLPKGATVKPLIPLKKVKIKPGDELLLKFRVEFPVYLRTRLNPPYDGFLKGCLCGELSGSFIGRLTEVKARAERITGKLTGTLDNVGSFVGQFEGKVNRERGTIEGNSCVLLTPYSKGCRTRQEAVGICARLSPVRDIEFTQKIDGEIAGGVSLRISEPDGVEEAIDCGCSRFCSSDHKTAQRPIPKRDCKED